ncbi:MAG: type III secretion HpaP family protein [Myxococcota bacterium]
MQQAEAREEERVNSAITGHGHRGSGGGGGNSQHDPPTTGIDALGESKGAPGTAASPQARAVQQVSEQILAALAREVFVGFNERGFAEMRIELHEGVLQGGTLRVEAHDGEIRLRFEGLSGHARNLVSSSEGELSRRLQAKGLRLTALVA